MEKLSKIRSYPQVCTILILLLTNMACSVKNTESNDMTSTILSNIKKVRNLKEEHNSVAGAWSCTGNNELAKAVILNDQGKVEKLLKSNIDLSLQNDQGFTALELACIIGNKNIVIPFLTRNNFESLFSHDLVKLANYHSLSEDLTKILFKRLKLYYNENLHKLEMLFEYVPEFREFIIYNMIEPESLNSGGLRPVDMIYHVSFLFNFAVGEKEFNYLLKKLNLTKNQLKMKQSKEDGIRDGIKTADFDFRMGVVWKFVGADDTTPDYYDTRLKLFVKHSVVSSIQNEYKIAKRQAYTKELNKLLKTIKK